MEDFGGASGARGQACRPCPAARTPRDGVAPHYRVRLWGVLPPIPPPASPSPEFAPVEFDASAADVLTKGTSCASCDQDIRAIYYEAAGKVICPSCRGELEAHISPTGGRAGRFGRAFVFGLMAAAAGAALYYLIRAITGYEIGLVAVLVGFMVGKAVFFGSGRRGGRRYQVLAVGLTYSAMALTYAPIAMERGLVVVFALPILVGVSSIISVFILGFALVQAWQMNKAVDISITGPYRITAPSPATTPAPAT